MASLDQRALDNRHAHFQSHSFRTMVSPLHVSESFYIKNYVLLEFESSFCLCYTRHTQRGQPPLSQNSKRLTPLSWGHTSMKHSRIKNSIPPVRRPQLKGRPLTSSNLKPNHTQPHSPTSPTAPPKPHIQPLNPFATQLPFS